MTNIPVRRRVALALIGVCISGYLLRPQISQALVIRGDERLYRGSAVEALEYYRRAVVTDPLDGAAVDRFVFDAVSLRKRRAAVDALAVASAYLARRENDDVARMDRAMAYRLLGDSRRAANDFERVGVRERDATALTFAGYADLASHRRAQAVAMWRRALSIAPHFTAARHALERYGAQS